MRKNNHVREHGEEFVNLQDSQVQCISSTELVTTVSQEKLSSDIRLAASLLLQVLHDPVRQRFGRGGVLAGIQLTVNHDVSLKKCFRLFKICPKFYDPVLQ